MRKIMIENWMDWLCYDKLTAGECNCPHKILGKHECGGGMIYTAYRPGAQKISIVCGKKTYDMENIGNEGYFAFFDEDWDISSYEYRVQYSEDDIITYKDPYIYGPVLGDVDKYLFHEGTHYEVYKKLGAHIMTIDGVKGTFFAVWAPHARSVSVVGNFNMWDKRLHQMRRLDDSGIHELFIPDIGQGEIYKFCITTGAGETLFKSDPYAFYSELRPQTASVVYDIEGYSWKDDAWMKKRGSASRADRQRMPMSIYECHIGSWKRNPDGSFYGYKQLADELVDYLKEMNYTHIELMGISEYPFDGSWGYQVTGYYAPTSRYGTPKEFMYLVDTLHKNGIGVILDWVPAHFPRDAHGLGRFDGEPLYEYSDPRKGEHPDWGTYIFDYSSNEVCDFLISNALYWANEYHIDALRVDAVASMLYLDYGKQDGAWLPNPDGSNDNKDVVRFFGHLNSIIEERGQGLYMIAEESTSWAGVTAPVEFGGLGFMFKWNMGWMNDFLDYMKTDPLFRSGNHNKLCFSMMYAYSENFIQVLSHDEVVHGKASMIYKMPGDMPHKFANLKTAYAFMYGHPGKKLLFMGQEFAQTHEWNEEVSLEWNLLEYVEHKGVKDFVRKLNELYVTNDAMYYNDYDPMGFEWLTCDDNENSVVSFVRRGSGTKKNLLFIFNFTPVEHEAYKIGVLCPGKYTEILNSDDKEYGGSGCATDKVLNPVEEEYYGREYSLTIKLPPLSARVFEYDYTEPKKKARPKKSQPKKQSNTKAGNSRTSGSKTSNSKTGDSKTSTNKTSKNKTK